MMLYVIVYANFRVVAQQSRMGLPIVITAIGGIIFYLLFFKLLLFMNALSSRSLYIFFNQTVLIVILMLLPSICISMALSIFSKHIIMEPRIIKEPKLIEMLDTTVDT